MTSRKRLRLDQAIAAFEQAYREVAAWGWNPLQDADLTERRGGAPQRILALEFTT